MKFLMVQGRLTTSSLEPLPVALSSHFSINKLNAHCLSHALLFNCTDERKGRFLSVKAAWE